MGSDSNYRLKKKIVFDPEYQLDRICWVLDTFCPVCGEPIEVDFDELPSEIEILEAEAIPCDECLAEFERDFERDEEMEAVIKELFGHHLPERKS